MKIGVIGAGRLGICFALLCEAAGYEVLVSDIREDYVKGLNERRIDSTEPEVDNLLKVAKNFRATIVDIENKFRDIADGENVIVGTKENPIIPNSNLCSTESIFSHGVYAREMFVKKDSIVIGAIHKDLHMCF